MPSSSFYSKDFSVHIPSKNSERCSARDHLNTEAYKAPLTTAPGNCNTALPALVLWSEANIQLHAIGIRQLQFRNVWCPEYFKFVLSHMAILRQENGVHTPYERREYLKAMKSDGHFTAFRLFRRRRLLCSSLIRRVLKLLRIHCVRRKNGCCCQSFRSTGGWMNG